MIRRFLVCGFLLLAEGSALADWMGTADFTDCPREFIPNTSGTEGGFASEADCKARIAQVERESPMLCARYACVNRTSAAAGTAGRQMDEHIANAISAGVTGQISVGDAAGLATLGVIGNALLAPRGGSAAQKADPQRAQATEQQRVVEANKSASADRLLAEMLPEPGDSGGQRGIMSGVKSGPAPRIEPRAVLRQPTLSEQLMDDPEPVAKLAATPATTPAARADPSPSVVDGFTTGVEHGSGCFSQNAGPICSGAAPEEWAACLDDYRRGYGEGDRSAKFRIDLAYRNGANARATAAMNNGASQPDAVGPCRIDIVKAYNSGYAGAPHP